MKVVKVAACCSVDDLFIANDVLIEIYAANSESARA